jgi:hypothetical protein
MQDRLGLVVGRVGDEDVACGAVAGRLLEECVPQPSGPGLQSLPSAFIRLADGHVPPDELQAEPLGEGRDELPIRGRGRAQIVLGVSDDDPRPGRRDLRQCQEQGHAVGAPGHADQERRSPDRGAQPHAQRSGHGLGIASGSGDGVIHGWPVSPILPAPRPPRYGVGRANRH